MNWTTNVVIIFVVSQVISLAIWSIRKLLEWKNDESENEYVTISDIRDVCSTELKDDSKPVHGLYPQFISSDDFPSEANNGDMLVKDGCVYMYQDSKDEWVEMDSLDDTTTEAKHDYPTTCTHCGAPLHSHKCEYCGCEY